MKAKRFTEEQIIAVLKGADATEHYTEETSHDLC